jgi:hypothetical protein
VQRIILQECWRSAFARYLIPKVTALRLDLDRFSARPSHPLSGDTSGRAVATDRQQRRRGIELQSPEDRERSPLPPSEAGRLITLLGKTDLLDVVVFAIGSSLRWERFSAFAGRTLIHQQAE